MKKPLTFRVFGLMSLAIVTSIVTASIASQVRRSSRAGDEPSATARKKVSVAKVLPAAPKAVAEGGQVPGTGPEAGGVVVPSESGGLDNVSVKADGDLLLVSADASIQDTRGFYEYLWAVRLFDPEDKGRQKPLFWWFYTENRWKIGPRGQGAVPLRDALQIPLPKKKYRVELSVLLVPPGADLSRLKDPAKASKWSGPAAVRSVVVGR